MLMSRLSGPWGLAASPTPGSKYSLWPSLSFCSDTRALHGGTVPSPLPSCAPPAHELQGQVFINCHWHILINKFHY